MNHPERRCGPWDRTAFPAPPMKRRLPLLLMLAAMAAAVVFCVLWRQAAADRSQLTDLARSGAAEAVRRFSDYQSRGGDGDYWGGVAAFHTFQQASALLPEDGADGRAACSAVYGSLLLSPDRAKEHLPGLASGGIMQYNAVFQRICKAVSPTKKDSSWPAVFRAAFPHTVPIMTGYLVLSLAYGVLMRSKGYGALWSLCIILLVAAATILTRFLPFILFPQGKKHPKIIDQQSPLLPPAMMGLLVVYCLRSVDVSAPPHGLPELIAIAVTAGLHLWKRNTLISIGAGTVVYMLLVQLVFA